MGSFTIWHWLVTFLVIAILVLPFYGVSRFARRYPPADNSASGPVGVGGFLLFLVVGLMWLGPVFGALMTASEFGNAELANPRLQGVPAWETFQAVFGGFFLAGCLLSIYTGYGLAKGRTRAVVKRAIIALWVLGPVLSIVMGAILPVAVLGVNTAQNPEFWGQFFASCIFTTIWTLYLLKSRRVKATYGLA